MPAESASLSLLSVISLASFFVALLTSKFSDKIGNGILLDHDFKKPQAFHNELIPRSGGLAGIISLLIFFILYNLLFQEILIDYLMLSIFMFSLGFLEDVNFKINPNYRLILMIALLVFFITSFSINLGTIDFVFLNHWMKNNMFSIIFLTLCFLFIINGANLIDGFNGLLTIHLLIINLILLFLNLNNNNETLTVVITAQIVVLLSFLLFNFPRAKMFLGDGGSYLFGSLVAFNVIQTNNLNPEISSFFFFGLLGITNGLANVLGSSTWAEIYGVKHIGSIKALTTALMVFSTAFGTALFGILIDIKFSIEQIAIVSGAYILTSIILLYLVRNKLNPKYI